MSKDFDWRTGDEDDRGWDEPSSAHPERPSFVLPAWLKRWGPWLGGLVVLLIIVGLVISNLFDRQVEEVEDTTTADLLNAHLLLRQAINDQDFELLEALIADNNNNWRDLQLELLNVHLLLDRQPMGLKLLPETAVSEPYSPTITLSPDLQTAEVVDQIPYQITSGERLSETVWLEQTYQYQRQEESWLLTPLPDDETFWGTWNDTDYGDYFTLIYTDRDEVFADYLGVRFDELIGRICQDDVIKCPGNFHVEFRLDRQPLSLTRLNESYRSINILASQRTYHFSMPSPTLIGRPVNESDYDALYQGYANWLAAVITSRYLVEGGTYEGNPFEITLAAWGLEPPPPPITVLPIPKSLITPPIPFPEQDILVDCGGFDSLAILRFNLRSNKWQDELADVQDATTWFEQRQYFGSNMVVLPDDSGVLVSLNQPDLNEYKSRIVSLVAGRDQLWFESDFIIQLIPAGIQQQFDPSGRKLIVIDIRINEENSQEEFQILPYVLDVEDCQAGNCSLQAYDGIPYFSPDFTWVLVVDIIRQSTLLLKNEQSGEVIDLGSGFSPYWLDAETFIYVNVEGEPEAGDGQVVQILKATVEDPLNGTVLVDSADIEAAIIGDDSAVPVRIDSIIAHPDQPDWLFIAAAIDPLEESRSNYILSFRADTGETAVMIELEDNSLTTPFNILQDGRLLSVQTIDDDFSSMMLSLIPLNPDEKSTGTSIETYEFSGQFQVDWSQDGRWLIFAQQGSLRLVAPGYDYEETIDYNADYCEQAVWVNPLTESSP